MYRTSNPSLSDAHRGHVERVRAVRRELLEPVVELARLAPVAGLADAADVDRAVRPDHGAVDARLQAGGVPEGGALVRAVDLLEERPLQPAVGDVAEEHLPGERPLLEQHGVARRVRDLVLRQPQHGLGHRLGVEGPGRVVVVVEEPVLLDVQQLRGRQPRTLVVHDEQLALRSPAEAVGRPEPSRDVADLTGLAVDRDARPAVRRRLRVRGRAAVVDRDRERHVEVLLVVQQTEGELVERPAVRPLGHRAVLEEPVTVDVGHELGQPVALGDVDRAVDDRDAHGVEQAGGDLRDRHLVGAGLPRHAAEDEHLARLRVGHRPGRAHRARGDEDELAVRGPVEGRDHGLEALRQEVGEGVARVHRVEAQAIARGVGVPGAVLGPRGRHADDVALGAERGLGHEHEVVGAGRAPLEAQHLVEPRLEVLDPERVVTGRQLGDAVLRRGLVQAVVVDDELLVDQQARAVVADEAEGVLAVGRDVEVGEDVRAEVVRAAELLVGRPVDRRHELVDVGRGAGPHLAEGLRWRPQRVRPQGDALLLGRQLGGVRGGRQRRRRHHGAEQGQTDQAGEACRAVHRSLTHASSLRAMLGNAGVSTPARVRRRGDAVCRGVRVRSGPGLSPA